MRQGLIVALALAGAACSGSETPNQGRPEAIVQPLPNATAPGDSYNVRTDGAGGCYYELNLRRVERAALAQRTREVLDNAVAAVGGIDNMRASDIPYFNLRVDPEATFSCLEPVLALIRDPGGSRVGLEPYGTTSTPHFVHFPLTEMGAAAPTVTVAIAPDGSTTWNGEAVDRTRLGERARALALSTREAGAAGKLHVVPADTTRFTPIYETIKAIRENGVQPDMGVLLPLNPEMARSVRR